jgi:hypothetical protein
MSLLHNLDLGRSNGIGDIRVALVRQVGDEYQEKYVFEDGYNLVRTKNPEDDSYLLLIDSEVVEAKNLLIAAKKPTHVKIINKIYTIDYGDIPIGEEEVIQLRLSGTNETSAPTS